MSPKKKSKAAKPRQAAEKPQGKSPKPRSQTSAKPAAPSNFIEQKQFYAFALVLLAAFALIAYLPGFNGQFLYDDLPNIVSNAYIKITSLKPSVLFSAAFQDFQQNRPLSNLSFAINYFFNGNKPFGFHLVNFLFHLVSGFSLFLVLERILARRGNTRGQARLIGFLAALLWLVHPINTQAVTYIVQRHSVMAGCFSLLCLLCYDLGRSDKRPVFYALAALSGFCALLCKESAFVLPALVFVYDLWFFQDLEKGWLRRNWMPLAAIAGFYLLGAAFVFRGSMVARWGSEFTRLGISPLHRELSQARVLLWYISLIIFPSGPRLMVIHDFAGSTSLLRPATTMPAIALVLAIVAFAFARGHKYPLLSFAIIWYFSSLLIESLPLPIDLIAEHRLYLASIAVIVLFPVALSMRLKNLVAMVVANLLITAMLAGLSYERNRDWQGPFALWRDTISKAPQNPDGWKSLCAVTMDKHDQARARTFCKQAALLRPDYGTYTNLGSIYFADHDYQAAEEVYLKAIALRPDFGLAYFNMGMLKASSNDFESAKAYFIKALGLTEKDERVFVALGPIFERLNDPQDAVRAYQYAIKIRPELPDSRAKLAELFAGQGRCPEAVALIKAAPAYDQSYSPVLSRCKNGQ